MRTGPIVATALVLCLGACGAKPPAATDEVAGKPADTEPARSSATDDAPLTSPPAQATGSLRVDLPAEGAIGFAGFGPAKFGATAEEVRMAWGGDLGDAAPDEPGGCYYLTPQPQHAQGDKIGFMIEGDRFVRIDVASDAIAAPGGGRVGMSADELRVLYGSALESMPHKYVEGGRYLSVAASGAAPSKLVFETDENGKATHWRIGLAPQVDYVEGCS
ncbi:MAG: hypothetical protein QM761_00665 [Pseudoxanthomonas sp.]